MVDSPYIGVDGCKGGWICAVLGKSGLSVGKYSHISGILDAHGRFSALAIDMPVGLQSSPGQIRPDALARRLIRERASTIFPAPCRQAVYAGTVSQAYSENERVLGKKLTPLAVGLIPKIRELDSFLQQNPSYKNRLVESHPEVCFAALNGGTVLTKKKTPEGQRERAALLERYLKPAAMPQVQALARLYTCHIDDVIDAVCLAVTARFIAEGNCTTIPENPSADDTGLLMQMVLPLL